MKKVFFGIALLVSFFQNASAQSQDKELAFNEKQIISFNRKTTVQPSSTTSKFVASSTDNTQLNQPAIQQVSATIKFVPSFANEEDFITPPDDSADAYLVNETILPANFLEEPKQEDITVYTFVEQAPEYKYGQTALYKWLYRVLTYPAFAIEHGIRGTVLVTFVVEKDGSITDVAVKKGIVGGKVLEEEAVRVVKQMPKWKPGKQNGRLVRVLYTLPVHFKIR